ncbi:hypothetical protein ACQEWB_15715 [Streptomyces sp. CA-249302]|uniref:hypothetical protein n=1 Tax=Streptomyces sp. CA-249302 TaxID=3240058 RepID=UPI003D92F0ED
MGIDRQGPPRSPKDSQSVGRGFESHPPLEAELRLWAERYGKLIVVTGCGADTYAGAHGTVPGPWIEEYQADLLDMHHRVFDRVDGNKKGVFTRERRPKAYRGCRNVFFRGSAVPFRQPVGREISTRVPKETET